MFWLELGSFDWQCLLGNYPKFSRFAGINYNNNNSKNKSSPAVVVVVVIVFVGLRRLWHLFLKIFIDFGFGFAFVCCLALCCRLFWFTPFASRLFRWLSWLTCPADWFYKQRQFVIINLFGRRDAIYVYIYVYKRYTIGKCTLLGGISFRKGTLGCSN